MRNPGLIAGTISVLNAVLIALVFAVATVAGGGGLGSATPNGPTHDGSEVAVDLPLEMRVTNTVGTDGLGLCVWASIEMMARYHNEETLIGIFDQMKGEPGGGWPSRVEKEMNRRGLRDRYRQFYGPAEEGLKFIRDAQKSGRMVCATYGYGEFYGQRTIAHMICVVQANSKHAGVLDNNDIKNVWWMDEAEFKRRSGWPQGEIWALYLLGPAPPPAPHN